jgi:hypothetical protein
LLTAVNKDCYKDYYKNTETELAPLEESQAQDTKLIDQILQANRTSNTLVDLWEKAGKSGQEDWRLENRLLQYQGRLVVPEEGTLCTDLIREAHTQLSTAVIARVARGQQEGLQYSRDNNVTQITML